MNQSSTLSSGIPDRPWIVTEGPHEEFCMFIRRMFTGLGIILGATGSFVIASQLPATNHIFLSGLIFHLFSLAAGVFAGVLLGLFSGYLVERAFRGLQARSSPSIS